MFIITSTIGTELQILGQLRHLNNLLHGYEPGLKMRVVGSRADEEGRFFFRYGRRLYCNEFNMVELSKNQQVSTGSSESLIILVSNPSYTDLAILMNFYGWKCLNSQRL